MQRCILGSPLIFSVIGVAHFIIMCCVFCALFVFVLCLECLVLHVSLDYPCLCPVSCVLSATCVSGLYMSFS